MTTQTIKFKAHDGLIRQMIYNQHGEHFKAVMELIQNAEDSGSTRISLSFTDKGFVVSDNGSGFPNKEYIENYFATFGTPHVEGDSKFGRFRIGRGQVMSLACVSWRSKQWEMRVDVSQSDEVPAFDLTTHEEVVKGCTVSGGWFTKMEPFLFAQQNQKLLKAIQFFSIPILNEDGKMINKIPENEQWDHETDYFYYKKSESHSLALYNQGAFVCNMSGYDSAGVTGILVTKKHLKLNTARNSIISSCTLWHKIKKELNSISLENSQTEGPLSSHERDGMFLSWLCSEHEGLAVNRLNLIQDIKGKFHPIKRLLSCKLCLVDLDAKNDFVVDKVYQMHGSEILFLSIKYLDYMWINSIESFNESVKTASSYYLLKDEFNQVLRNLSNYTIPSIDFEVLSDGMNDKMFFVDKKDLKKPEAYLLDAYSRILKSEGFQKRFLRAFIRRSDIIEAVGNSCYSSNYYWDMLFYIRKDTSSTGLFNQLEISLLKELCDPVYRSLTRTLKIGISDTADAWTDGITYMALNKDVLTYYKKGYEGFFSLSALIAHEFCHTESNLDTHVHEIEFYENFHRLMQRTLSDGESPIMYLTRMAYRLWMDLMEKNGQKIQKFHYNNLECQNRTSKIKCVKNNIVIKLNDSAIITVKHLANNQYYAMLKTKKDILAFQKKFPKITLGTFFKERERLEVLIYEFVIQFNDDLISNSCKNLLTYSFDSISIYFNELDHVFTRIGRENGKKLKKLIKDYLKQSEIGKVIDFISNEISKATRLDEEVFILALTLGRTTMKAWDNEL